MSFRNRCLIGGPNGIISLSIPLEYGRNQQLPMHEVKIASSEPWQSLHWKSIQSSYNRSPFFDHYKDELNQLFCRKVEKLMDWNLRCLEWVMEKLDRGVSIRLTESPEQESDPGLWEDHRDEVLPKNHGLYMPVKYQQVFEEKTGFLPNLSILDLLFNRGKEASNLLGAD